MSISLYLRSTKVCVFHSVTLNSLFFLLCSLLILYHTSADAYLQELNSLHFLYLLVVRCCECLSLWKLLCDYQLHLTVSGLGDEDKVQLLTATFRTMVLSGRKVSIISYPMRNYLIQRPHPLWGKGPGDIRVVPWSCSLLYHLIAHTWSYHTIISVLPSKNYCFLVDEQSCITWLFGRGWMGLDGWFSSPHLPLSWERPSNGVGALSPAIPICLVQYTWWICDIMMMHVQPPLITTKILLQWHQILSLQGMWSKDVTVMS